MALNKVYSFSCFCNLDCMLLLDRGSIRSSPRYGLSTPYRLTIRNSAKLFHQHGRPAFGPSCTEFVYPECWHFDNDAASKIEDVLTEHGGLLHVLPLAVHLKYFFCWTSRGDHSE